MIKQVTISNYKSITELELPLGRVTVLIGANGSGKSNILEAIALGAAASNAKLDNEFLASRGIRVPDDPRYLRAAFHSETVQKGIAVSFLDEQDGQSVYELQKDNEQPYSSWTRQFPEVPEASLLRKLFPEQDKLEIEKIVAVVAAVTSSNDSSTTVEQSDGSLLEKDPLYRSAFAAVMKHWLGPKAMRGFLIYSPENMALRTFEEEGQIQPLGIRGEGLLKLLRVLASTDRASLQEIKDRLSLVDWFSDFEVSEDILSPERSLRIRDKYLDSDLEYFNQKSANEGFLFLLFYFSLFISKDTPSFFAIDNVDASLNPKLCSQLMSDLADLAAKKGKQVILTTHNPAILDGLNLNDDEQRLFVVSRNRQGHTRIQRVPAPHVPPGESPVRLSEAFLRGYIGGLPKNF